MDQQKNVAGDVEAAPRFSTGLIVLLSVGGLLLLFLIGSYALSIYAHKTIPLERKKPVSKKKSRKDRLKHVFPAPGINIFLLQLGLI